MRAAGLALILAATLTAQFKSNVPLVVAPTTVTDSQGHYIDALTQQDLILYDNNVPQTIQMSESAYPISLVVAIQTSDNSGAVIDKLGRIGILLSQLLAADAGETAVLSFSDEVKLHQGISPPARTPSLTPCACYARKAQMRTFWTPCAREIPLPAGTEARGTPAPIIPHRCREARPLQACPNCPK